MNKFYLLEDLKLKCVIITLIYEFNSVVYIYIYAKFQNFLTGFLG